MFRRILGWLRHTGDPVVEEFAPGGPVTHAEAWQAREDEIADIDAQVLAAWQSGEKVLVDRLLDMRLGVRAPRPAPRVRSSVPVIPGRSDG